MPLSERGGFTDIRDYLTGAIHSVVGTNTTWSQAPFGSALTFNKASGIPVNTNLFTASNDLSITATFCTSSASDSVLVSNNYGQQGRFDFKCCALEGGATYRPFIFIGNSGGSFALIGNTTSNDGQWHHIAATRNSGNWTLYLDGQAENAGTTANAIDLTEPFRIARGGEARQSQWMDGSIGNIEFYNRALTASQVRQLAIDPLHLYRPDSSNVLYSFPTRPYLVLRRFV